MHYSYSQSYIQQQMHITGLQTVQAVHIPCSCHP